MSTSTMISASTRELTSVRASHKKLHASLARSVTRRATRTRASATTAPVTTPSGVIVEREDLPEQGSVKLSVRVPEALLQKCYDAVVNGFNDTVTVPGFNASKKGEKAKNKIPMQLLINHVGKKEFKSACVEEALQNSLPEAMELVSANALQDSERITTHFLDMFEAFGGMHSRPSEDLKYEVLVELEPMISFTGDYKALSVKVQSLGDDNTAEKDAEVFYKNALKDLSTLRVCVDRGLVIGDAAVVDVDAIRVNDDGTDGEPLGGMKQDNFQLDTGDENIKLPGLLENIEGMEVGEKKSFEITFPGDWPQAYVRNVKARFTVTVKELFAREFPKDDDKLADKIFPGSTSIADAKEKILESVKAKNKFDLERAIDEACVDALAEICDVRIPRSLIEEQGRNMYSEQLLAMQVKQKMSPKALESLASAKMVNEYLTKQKNEIEKVCRRTIACEQVIKLENLSVTGEELHAEVEKAKSEFEEFGTEYNENQLYVQAQETLEAKLAFKWLKENCKVEILPPSRN
ncbi:Peptidyl-prolyl cis-trans isomerase,FKBP-type,domain [Ostreococcus tauri]|uniref:peptidylprolyl isomerase n=1 Tax=Ostreococcus tauri TaxID=70448 RepID=A0A090M7K7_OSTTA|nr:Peptidyl-prolyl cis-trans isomerase,FKBP-type,domain [Ostreococcus tauri]CEG01018.1 Peptidyl-prolyl cis-trans isomerase,FKBP-type,domain [Ostreococcus tauri]|eukprot:XP_003075014.2 Peptidyl-prolyl cis-trans isomerase,FKBP-type,domain [Ostreococcus tauri]